MPDMVKGAGYLRRQGQLQPLEDGDQVDDMSSAATKAVLAATKEGIAYPGKVAGSFSPYFMPQLQNVIQSNPMQTAFNQLVTQVSAAIGKDITLTSPLSSGLVPFNLEFWGRRLVIGG